MPCNYYEGVSEKDLLAMRARLQRQGGGGAVTRSSIAGVSVEKSAVDCKDREIELKRVQYALWLIGEDHVTTGLETTNPYTNPYQATIRRTSAHYVG